MITSKDEYLMIKLVGPYKLVNSVSYIPSYVTKLISV